MASQGDQADVKAAGRQAVGVSASAATPGVERAAPGQGRVRRALISVSDKTGVVELASGLAELGVEIVSTGGTAHALIDAGVEVLAIEDFTGFPEMMDGRVKTLHPRLYAGLLARRDKDSHLTAAAAHEIDQVDLVCVNLYPFEQTVARADASEQEAIENIDIGGPTMIRAAAKNHDYAAVLIDPADYESVLAELRSSGGMLSLETRRRLASSAFALTARYDAAISTWFAAREVAAHALPPRALLSYEKAMDLRYGENPHQRGAYYTQVGASSHLLSGISQLHGKELSFNNLLDLSAARELAFDFESPACAIVKHNNPCGCALAKDALGAYERAFACDPMSAFGGVIAFNRRINKAAAEAIAKQFVEVLLAPGFDEDALQVLRQSKNVRLLDLAVDAMGDAGDRTSQTSASATLGGAPQNKGGLEYRPISGGLLVQDRDAVIEARQQMRQMGKVEPREGQWQDLLFAWQVCMRVRSNAIVIVKDGATIGVGAGQMSRVDAVRIAVEKAKEFCPEMLAGSSLASDAYFPFPDAPQLGIDAGVTAIIQPGGSIRDELSVEAADAAGVAMGATGIRHFRH